MTMLLKQENADQNLSHYLFELFWQKSKEISQWCLINEVPDTLLTDEQLLIENINFHDFGYKLSHLNFKNCHFQDSDFSDQILIDCDFSGATYKKLHFSHCII